MFDARVANDIGPLLLTKITNHHVFQGLVNNAIHACILLLSVFDNPRKDLPSPAYVYSAEPQVPRVNGAPGRSLL
jgi:hypothetical protein